MATKSNRWRTSDAASILVCASVVILTLGLVLLYLESTLQRVRLLEALASYTQPVNDTEVHPCSDVYVWFRCVQATCHWQSESITGHQHGHWYHRAEFAKALAHTDGTFRAYLLTPEIPYFVTGGSWDDLRHRGMPYVLVLGSADQPLSSVWPSLAPMIDHPLCQAAYCTNCDIVHPKLIAMPIGMPYHALASLPNPWPVEAMDSLLHRYAKAALNPKANRVLINFKVDTPERHRAVTASEVLPANERLVLPRNTPFWDVWASTSASRFVLSPPGHGTDCYRHWEALVLGAVPIILRASGTAIVESLFTNLPVVLVDAWDEVTSEALQQWWTDLQPARKAFYSNGTNVLTSKYWMQRILNETSAP